MSRSMLLVLILALSLLAAALVAAVGCRGCHNGTEKFEGGNEPPVTFFDLPVLQGVDGQRYDRLEILDGSKQELGWCLAIDGRIQMCQADVHKYHEMLVHFACAVRDLGPDKDKKDMLSALILYGGDNFALAEVKATKQFDESKIVVLEDEGSLSELCESLDRFNTKKVESFSSSAVRYDGNIKKSLVSIQRKFDLIVLDLKDRFSPMSGETDKNTKKPVALSKATCQKLTRLLAPGGILSVGSMLPSTQGNWFLGVDDLAGDKCLAYRLPFTFFSEVRSGHVKMELFADWDMGSAVHNESSIGLLQKNGDVATSSSSSSRLRPSYKFFDPTKPLTSYIVPWIASM